MEIYRAICYLVTLQLVKDKHYIIPTGVIFLLIATLAVVGYPCPVMGMAIGLCRRRLI